MKYKKGISGNPAGCPAGAHNEGRPPDWLKEKCKDIIDKNNLVDFLGAVAIGKAVDYYLDSSGNKITCPAKIKDRITATKELLDRGFGKTIQQFEVESSRPRTFLIRSNSVD